MIGPSRDRGIGLRGHSPLGGGTEMESGKEIIGPGDQGVGREPRPEEAITMRARGSEREIEGGGMRAQGGDDFFTLLLPSNGYLRLLSSGLAVYANGEYVLNFVSTEGRRAENLIGPLSPCLSPPLQGT